MKMQSMNENHRSGMLHISPKLGTVVALPLTNTLSVCPKNTDHQQHLTKSLNSKNNLYLMQHFIQQKILNGLDSRYYSKKTDSHSLSLQLSPPPAPHNQSGLKKVTPVMMVDRLTHAC